MVQCVDPDGISVLRNWDPEVSFGCMERIKDPFLWNDLHWFISKSELITRVHEWNSALLQYCDDKNFTGAKREEVIRVYSASPLARCANPTCGTIETKIKEFHKCSKCNRVAYCSRTCQAHHWKPSHKKLCVSNDSAYPS
uniref:MYND-type domain-containing protein n=1 Tax=Proboscia inermis TaxID=420281 RepID=A0A7S0C6D5_9STRA|mmetsp:Transcript_2919/g.2936  ORF Transcript_2919/g.2936 Transcript_2919/m.2936 type:complete len:140 (+) Transcript_2919:3-422(+)